MKIIDPSLFSKSVILCNGNYPTHQLPLKILQNADRVVCCDGAANKYIKEGNIPAIIIGDGDSIDKKYLDQYSSIFIKNTDQEINDLTKAFRHLYHNTKIKDIAILGATGKREDHTLGNISLLLEYYKEGANVAMYTDSGIFIPTKGNTEIKTEIGTQISFINFDATTLSAQGVKFPLSPFSNWWQGTLNEATSETIKITTDGHLIIFLTYP